MTLLELIKQHGKIELTLAELDGKHNKVKLNALGGGEKVTLEVEQLYFATGGSVTLVHDFGG